MIDRRQLLLWPAALGVVAAAVGGASAVGRLSEPVPDLAAFPLCSPGTASSPAQRRLASRRRLRRAAATEVKYEQEAEAP